MVARSLPARRWLIAANVAGLAFLGVLGLRMAVAAMVVPEPSDPAAPSLTLPIKLMAAGDIACGPAIEPLPGECADVSPLADGADLVVTLGDTTYPVGAADEWPTFDAMWGDLPLLAVPGNHEYHTDHAQPFYDYFGERTSDLGYWSVDLLGWRIYGLNSNCSHMDCEAELRWLREARKDEPACTIAAIHQPLRSTYRSEELEDVGPLYDALDGVDLILAGHAHTYERIDLDGTTLIIAGTGGRNLYPFDDPPVEGSIVRYSDAYGVLSLTLEEGRYESAFVTFDGERDGFGDAC